MNLAPEIEKLGESVSLAPRIELGVAPGVPQWPAGITMKAEKHAGSGTWLPEPVDEIVEFYIRYLLAYPELCQTSLDYQADIYEAAIDEERDVTEIAERRDWEPPGARWDTGDIVLFTAGGVGFGITAASVVYFLMVD